MKRKYSKKCKEKNKIMRIRPYNMANFSGGSGYLFFGLFYGAIVSLPAAIGIWAGLALPIKKENGTLDYLVLNKRIHKIALPICLVLFVIFTIYCSQLVYGSKLVYLLEILWVGLIPTMGIYVSLYVSAKWNHGRNRLTAKRFAFTTVVLLILCLVIGVFGFFCLDNIIYWIGNL